MVQHTHKSPNSTAAPPATAAKKRMDVKKGGLSDGEGGVIVGMGKVCVECVSDDGADAVVVSNIKSGSPDPLFTAIVVMGKVTSEGIDSVVDSVIGTSVCSIDNVGDITADVECVIGNGVDAGVVSNIGSGRSDPLPPSCDIGISRLLLSQSEAVERNIYSIGSHTHSMVEYLLRSSQARLTATTAVSSTRFFIVFTLIQ